MSTKPLGDYLAIEILKHAVWQGEAARSDGTAGSERACLCSQSEKGADGIEEMHRALQDHWLSGHQGSLNMSCLPQAWVLNARSSTGDTVLRSSWNFRKRRALSEKVTGKMVLMVTPHLQPHPLLCLPSGKACNAQCVVILPSWLCP